MDGQIRRRDARPLALITKSLLRPPLTVGVDLGRKAPELVVTLNGVPVADQPAGVRMFAEACRRK